jgi:hypothetical protein
VLCALIETDGAIVLFTVIVTDADVAVVVEAQAAFEVSTQVITAPLVSEAVV